MTKWSQECHSMKLCSHSRHLCSRSRLGYSDRLRGRKTPHRQELDLEQDERHGISKSVRSFRTQFFNINSRLFTSTSLLTIVFLVCLKSSLCLIGSAKLQIPLSRTRCTQVAKAIYILEQPQLVDIAISLMLDNIKDEIAWNADCDARHRRILRLRSQGNVNFKFFNSLKQITLTILIKIFNFWVIIDNFQDFKSR